MLPLPTFQELAGRLPRSPRPVPLGGCEGRLMVLQDGACALHPWESAANLPLHLAPLLDHTLLKAGATASEIESHCREAREHGFVSVCVNPAWVRASASRLQESGVRVCTVVGFPLGATSPRAKAFEAATAVEDGADEVDMVLDLGAARSGMWGEVAGDLRAVRAAVPSPKVLKVILETCLLTDPEISQACRLAEEAGADFVKTSTGFSTGGATLEAVRLMRASVGPQVGVKASGGIRTREQALAMIRAGATRLGVSASLAIIAGGAARDAGY